MRTVAASTRLFTLWRQTPRACLSWQSAWGQQRGGWHSELLRGEPGPPAAEHRARIRR
ncbi:MAG: hypothetical protein HZA90_16715 [Verrucomicrobia bacterium]|nr:hypothetical protein [Verrucomicrobiota bacterium]